MGLELLLKGTPPWTAKQKRWFAVYCVTMVALILALIGFNAWLGYSVRRDMPFKIIEVGAPRWGDCDGHVMANLFVWLGDNGEHYGTRACFDVKRFRWVEKTIPPERAP